MEDKKSIIDLVSDKTLCHFNKGENIITQGETINNIHYIVDGNADVYHQNSIGKKVNFLQLKAGDYVGIHSLLKKEPSFVSVVANEELTTYMITKNVLNDETENRSEINLELIKQLCLKVESLEAKITTRISKSIKQRLARVLLISSDQLKLDQPGSFAFNIHDLAKLAGATRSYVYRILSEFERRKIISIKNKKILILNVKLLNEIIDQDRIQRNYKNI